MPQTPHVERHFTSGDTVRDVASRRPRCSPSREPLDDRRAPGVCCRHDIPR